MSIHYTIFCGILIVMERLKQDIKTGQFNRLYVLCGEDDYFRGFYKKSLKAAIMPEDDGMNYTEFSGKGVSVNEIMDTARTIPFLGERRLVIVNDSGLLNPAAKKKKSDDDESDEEPEADTKSTKKKSNEYGLAEFFAEIPDTTVLIFNEEKVNRASKIYKAAAKYGYVATFNPISEKEDGIRKVQGYVAARLRKENLNMTNGAFRLFIERTGTDLRVVFNELDKLICYVMGREAITEDDVRALLPDRIENKVFLMTEAMTNRDQKTALDLYYDLLRIKDEKPVMILSAIYKQYHQLYVIKKLSSEGMNYVDILKAADVRSDSDYVYKKLLRIAGRYTYDELKKAMEMCLDYDKAFRSGKMKDVIAVELVIVAMSSREELDA